MSGWVPDRFTVLSEGESGSTDGGGIITGSPELAYDIGRAVGWMIGSYMQVGRAFYSSGGLTGRNRLLEKSRL